MITKNIYNTGKSIFYKLIFLSIFFLILDLITNGFVSYTTLKVLEGYYLQDQLDPLKTQEWVRQDDPNMYSLLRKIKRTPPGRPAPNYGKNQVVEEYLKAKKNTKDISASSRSDGITLSNHNFLEKGPKNLSGRTRALLIDPDDSTEQTLFAGSAGGGLWKTTDGGENWSCISNDFPNLGVCALAMSPANTQIIYAGTGEQFTSHIDGAGLFKSSNKGKNWVQIADPSVLTDFKNVASIAVDPKDTDVVIVATRNSIWDEGRLKSAIYKTTDGGETWTRLRSTSLERYDDIAFNPRNFDTLYVGVLGQGVIKSIDEGLTWTDASLGMTNILDRVEITVSEIDPMRLWASCVGYTSGSISDLYVSSDGAKTWQLVVDANGLNQNFLSYQGWYNNVIAAHPFDKDIVYVGGVNLWKYELKSNVMPPNIYLNDNETQPNDNIGFATNTDWNYDNGRMNVNVEKLLSIYSVEIRMGPNIFQKAHRFTTNGGDTDLALSNYIYEDYVNIPFQIWDKENDQQLMASFRDQQEDGDWSLVFYELNGPTQSRSIEYLFIHDVAYNDTPNENIAQNGGVEHEWMYQLFPVRRPLSNEQNFNERKWKVDIAVEERTRIQSVATNISDAYYDSYNPINVYDSKVPSSFHPDQHSIHISNKNFENQTFSYYVTNDGGIYKSVISTDPGTSHGDFTFISNGYNTTQFYSADKAPDISRYIGGMQDNGTWYTKVGESFQEPSLFDFALPGDGYEVLWHSKNPNAIIASTQRSNFYKTLDGGKTWYSSFNNTNSPYASKVIHHKSRPDTIFILADQGILRSTDFGDNWEIKETTSFKGLNSAIEVSYANPDVIWASTGIFSNHSRLYISTNGGESFFTSTGYYSPSPGNISGIGSHPSNDQIAYVLFSFAKKPKIIKTEDQGQTWKDISGFDGSGDRRFPDVAINCIYVFSENENKIWVGTEIGIVQSLDGGNSWNLLECNMPPVEISNMKRVENELVIPTFGRGIWSITVNDEPLAPAILRAYTAPDRNIKIEMYARDHYDSIKVFVNDILVGKTTDIQQTENLLLSYPNLQNIDGSVPIKIDGYIDGNKYSSQALETFILNTNEIANHYITDFSESNVIEDFTTHNHFIISSLNNTTKITSKVLHTHPQPYLHNSNWVTYLRTPIVIDKNNHFMAYKDIAMIEKGRNIEVVDYNNRRFRDYVVVEASKDGKNWKSLNGGGYDARHKTIWSKNIGINIKNINDTLFQQQVIDLKNDLNVGDTVIIRFRLKSDHSLNYFGWVIDDLNIQEPENIPPTISETFLSPQNIIHFTLNSFIKYDSMLFYVNNQLQKTILTPKVAKGITYHIPNTSEYEGLATLKVDAYINGIVNSSEEIYTVIFKLHALSNSYITNFVDAENDFFLDRLTIEELEGFDNQVLHSPHPYGLHKLSSFDSYHAYLKIPIIVSNDLSFVKYQDVAIIEPGIATSFRNLFFYDYVIVEATKNGNEWLPISDGYDARLNTQWEEINDDWNVPNNSENNITIDKSLLVDHHVNLKNTFTPGDTILLRFRLYADAQTDSYGWVVDNLMIQGVQFLPDISKIFTSPDGKINIKLRLKNIFDSVSIYTRQSTREDKQFLTTEHNLKAGLFSGKYDYPSASQTTIYVSAIGYLGNKDYESKEKKGFIFDLNEPVFEYNINFDSESENTKSFAEKNPGFSISELNGFGDNNKVLYDIYHLPKKNHLIYLKTPIIVSPNFSDLSYEDVAIIEPGLDNIEYPAKEFEDYVSVEASADGESWTPLGGVYDSRLHHEWLNTYNTNATVDRNLFKVRNVDIKYHFDAGDTLLIRFKSFKNNNEGKGYGWVLDNLHIQKISVPIITKVFTSPDGSININANILNELDSMKVYINNTLLSTEKDIDIGNFRGKYLNSLPYDGEVALRLNGYVNNEEYVSEEKIVTIISVNNVTKLYNTDFTASKNDFLTIGFDISTPEGFEKKTLQSTHPYPLNDELYAYLRHPIKVDADYSILNYYDIALIEPGTPLKDYVILEGSKDGDSWQPLLNRYNSDFENGWLQKYTDNTPPTPQMFVYHETDLIDNFLIGDTILIRFKLFSDKTTQGYGWIINNLSIQDKPHVSINNLCTSPNGKINLKANITKDLDSLKIYIDNHLLATEKEISMGSFIGKYDNKANYNGFVNVKIEAHLSGKLINSREQRQVVINTNTPSSNFSSPMEDFLPLDFTIGSIFTLPTNPYNTTSTYLYKTLPFVQANDGVSYTYLKTPVVVSSYSIAAYRHIALLEPANEGALFPSNEYNDYIVIEASSDGHTWKPLREGHDAGTDNKWLQTYYEGQNAPINTDLFKTQRVDLKEHFATGDTILIRFKIFINDNNQIGYGWILSSFDIDNLERIPSSPHLTNVFTSPDGAINIQMLPRDKGRGLLPDLDSIEFYINEQLFATEKNLSEVETFYKKYKNGKYSGKVTIQAVGYYQGSMIRGNGEEILETFLINTNKASASYSTDFSNAEKDFENNGFVINKPSNYLKKTLHTQQPYPNDEQLFSYLRTPIIVSPNISTIVFDDIAFVEPGESGSTYPQKNFNDYVVVEGSSNGVNWQAIGNRYDVSFYIEWANAYASGTEEINDVLFRRQELNFLNHFSVGDTILLRFKLFSNNNNITGRGWFIDNLYIQKTKPPGKLPIIQNVFTDPKGNIHLIINLSNNYDKLEIYLADQLNTTITNVYQGVSELIIQNVANDNGNIEIHIDAYRRGLTHSSEVFNAIIIDTKSVVSSYNNNFNESNDDFVNSGFQIDIPNGLTDKCLHTYPNPYKPETSAYSYLRKPIEITQDILNFSFKHIALVEPRQNTSTFPSEEFNDYAVVEGSNDGNNWIIMGTPLDSKTENKWLDSYNSNENPTPPLYQNYSRFFSQYFSIGDTILLRFSMFTNNNPSVGQGWFIDDFMINEKTTETLPPLIQNVFTQPNGKVSIEYTTPKTFDSVLFYINDNLIANELNVSKGMSNKIIQNKNFNHKVEIKLKGYKNDHLSISDTYTAFIFTTNNVVTSYETNFTDEKINANFVIPNPSLSQKFRIDTPNGLLDNALYAPLNDVTEIEKTTVYLKTPIKIPNTDFSLTYRDIATVKNGFVKIEGTTDGKNWMPLHREYNADSYIDWTNTVNISSQLFKNQVIYLSDLYDESDTILIRFSVSTEVNSLFYGYGWFIDNIKIDKATIRRPTLSVNKHFEIAIYPNPATDKVFISLKKQTGTIAIFNSVGKLIKHDNITHPLDNITINIESLTPGIYYLKIKASHGSLYMQKLVVQ